MPTERGALIRELFGEVADLPQDERSRFLSERCGNDDGLRREIEDLLAHEAAVAPEFLADGSGDGDTYAPATTIGRYQIIARLGEGGCGTVYHARQTDPVERDVALKVIKAGMDTRQVIARFTAERQALALMDHPNIARLYDAGETDRGRPYFVMEQVNGVRISRHCDQERLDITGRLHLFLQVCSAVQHAHGKGIIHRDLKPSNILVELVDGYAVPKIIDFGIAKAMGRGLTEHTLLTEPGLLLGTPEYMSPEQASLDGRSVGPATDVYALGVILYELIVGVPPIDSERLRQGGLADIHRLIHDWDPPTPSTRLRALDVEVLDPRTPNTALQEIADHRHTDPRTLRRRLEGDLDAITMKAMAKAPSDRYPTASELAADVRRHLNVEAVHAIQTGLPYRVARALRRNRLPIAGTIALVAMAIVAFFAAGVFAIRAGQADDRTNVSQEALGHRDYANVIALAQRALHMNEPGRVARLLEACPEAMRGWEWLYLAQRSDRSILALDAHANRAIHIEFLSDDSRLITGGLDHTIRVRNLDTGQVLATMEGFDGWSGPFSLSPDGSRVAGAHVDRGVIAVWNVTTGEMIRRLRAHEARVHPIAFSRDGRYVATGAADGTAKIWDAVTWETVTTFSGHATWLNELVWTPDSRSIVSGSTDGTILVWDPATGEVRRRLGQYGRVSALAMHPGGALVASTHWDMTVRIWDLDDGSPLRSMSTGTDRPSGAAFSPDGDTLWVSVGAAVMIWPWTDPAAAPSFALGHFGGAGPVDTSSQHVGPLRFSPSGRQVASGAVDGEVRLWSTDDVEQPPRLRGHTRKPRGLAVSPAGDRIVSSSRDGTVRVWDFATRRHIATLRGHAGEVWEVAITRDGRRIVSGGADGTVRTWNADTGAELSSFPGHRDAVLAVALSPDDRYIASASADGTARVWAAADGRLVHELIHGARVDDVTFSRDDARVITCAYDGTVRVWDSTTGAEMLVLPASESSGRLDAVAVSEDGRWIAAGGAGTFLWDLDHPDRPRRFLAPSHGFISGVAISPDGRRVVSSGSAGVIDMWDTHSGALLLSLKGHGHGTGDIAFAPDGTWFVSAGGDLTIAIWDTMPVAIRDRERRQTLADDALARPIVDRLFDEGLDAAEVARRVRGDPRLSNGARRAALNAGLQRSALERD